MKRKSGPGKAPAEQVLKDVSRQTRRHYSAEEKIRLRWKGVSLRGRPRKDALRRAGLMVENCTYGQPYDQCAESTRSGGDRPAAALV